MKTSDQTMLFLLEYLKELKVIRFDKEFCQSIGIPNTILWNIRNEINSFTPEHIRMACKTYEVNANWIFGLSPKIFMHNRYEDIKPKKVKEKLEN